MLSSKTIPEKGFFFDMTPKRIPFGFFPLFSDL